MVGGLVQQQEVRRRNQHPGQRISVALAAGKHAQLLEDIVAGEHEAAQQRAQRNRVHPGVGARDVVQHLRIGVQHFVLVLREVVGA